MRTAGRPQHRAANRSPPLTPIRAQHRVSLVQDTTRMASSRQNGVLPRAMSVEAGNDDAAKDPPTFGPQPGGEATMQPARSPQPVLSRRQFAEAIGRSVSTVKSWERQGLIELRRYPSGRVFYTREDVQRVLAGSNAPRE